MNFITNFSISKTSCVPKNQLFWLQLVIVFKVYLIESTGILLGIFQLIRLINEVLVLGLLGFSCIVKEKKWEWSYLLSLE